MNSSSPKDDRPLNRRWELLILLLVVLLSFACVFLSTWLALHLKPEGLLGASILSTSRADYGGPSAGGTQFAVLDPGVVREAATDLARLAHTPGAATTTPALIVALPSPPLPTGTPTPTSTPLPTVATTSPTALPSATPTPGPGPTLAPPSTHTPPPPPTATRVPTVAPTLPSATLPPTATRPGTPVVTATSTSQRPSVTPSEPATPTETTEPPTATSTTGPTSTPTDTSTNTPTYTPTNTPTNTPTSTPTDFPGPVVLAMLPNTEVNTGTVTATILGQNFQSGCVASLEPIEPGSVVTLGATCTPTTTITATVPMDIIAGYYDLTVTNPDGRSGPLRPAYTATNPIPSISVITPRLAMIGSTRPVTISGVYFRNTGAPGDLRADLGGTPLTTLTYVSPTTLTAVVPSSLPLGVYALTVTNPGPTDPNAPLANALTVYGCEPDPSYCDSTREYPSLTVGPGGEITIDLGSQGITEGAGYDMVFYEFINSAIQGCGIPAGCGIYLDYITIELSEDGTSWYTVFAWDGIPGGVQGTNIDGAATDAGGEVDNEVIRSAAAPLYPGPPGAPNDSGIAIDIGAVQPPLPSGGPFRWVRLVVPDNGGDPTEIEGVVSLH